MNVWTTLIGRIFKGSARDAVIFGERTPRGKVTRRDGAPARTGAPSGNARAAVSAVCAAVTRTERAPAAVFASAMHAPAMPDPAAAQSAERAVRVSVVRRMFVAPAQLSAQPVPDDRLAAKGCARVSERCAVPNPAPSVYESVSRVLDARIDALGEALCGLNVAERFAAGKSAGYGRYKF